MIIARSAADTDTNTPLWYNNALSGIPQITVIVKQMEASVFVNVHDVFIYPMFAGVELLNGIICTCNSYELFCSS